MMCSLSPFFQKAFGTIYSQKKKGLSDHNLCRLQTKMLQGRTPHQWSNALAPSKRSHSDVDKPQTWRASIGPHTRPSLREDAGLNRSTTAKPDQRSLVVTAVWFLPLPRFQKLRGSAMHPAVVAALLLVAAAASPAAALYSAGSPVLQLNPNNFKSKVSPDSHCPSANRSASPF